MHIQIHMKLGLICNITHTPSRPRICIDSSCWHKLESATATAEVVHSGAKWVHSVICPIAFYMINQLL